MRAGVAWFLIAFLLALMPRTVAPERFVTVDEGMYWFGRTERFESALVHHQPAETWQAPHPGVITMWAGVAGRSAWRLAGGEIPASTPDQQAELRLWQRRGVAILTSLCVALSTALIAWRWGSVVGALSMIFLVFDPFLIAHSRILHTDALMSSFLLVAITGAAVAVRSTRRWAWDGVAVATALATLSKLPGLLAIPVTATLMALGPWAASTGTLDDRMRSVVRAIWRPLLRYAAIVAAVILVLWPATWAAPRSVIAGFGDGVQMGIADHEIGNFFHGRMVEDPGFFFYPVAIAFRLSPVVMLGLVPALWFAIRGRPESRLPLLAATLALIVLSLSAKKFDRYVLPVFPLLDLTAAIGWVQLGQAILRHRSAPRPLMVAALATLTAAAALAPWSIHPYEMSWYNPLLGGAKTANHWLLAGWGEGLEQVGDYIHAHDTDCEHFVATPYPTSIRPFLCQRADTLGNFRDADWVVLYANQVQRGINPNAVRAYRGKEKPVFVATAPNGEPLAWLYVARPQPESAAPGDGAGSDAHDSDLPARDP